MRNTNAWSRATGCLFSLFMRKCEDKTSLIHLFTFIPSCLDGTHPWDRKK